MELACESVDFGQTLNERGVTKLVLNAGEPTLWYDEGGFERIVVPATSMEVSHHKKLCSIVVYGQVLVTAEYDVFFTLPGTFVHDPDEFDGKQTHEWFMTSPYSIVEVEEEE